MLGKYTTRPSWSRPGLTSIDNLLIIIDWLSVIFIDVYQWFKCVYQIVARILMVYKFNDSHGFIRVSHGATWVPKRLKKRVKSIWMSLLTRIYQTTRQWCSSTIFLWLTCWNLAIKCLVSRLWFTDGIHNM